MLDITRPPAVFFECLANLAFLAAILDTETRVSHNEQNFITHMFLDCLLNDEV